MRPVLLALLMMTSAPAATAPAPADDRIDAERTAARVADQIALVRAGKLAEAERAIDRKVAGDRDKLTKAELLQSFGIELYAVAAAKPDRPMMEKALGYLDRAVTAYRVALGSDHPAVATALVSFAEVERSLRPDDPRPAVDAAYFDAYRIRMMRFGGSALVTLSTLVPMAELKALPSRTKGDPASALATAKSFLQEAIDGAARSNDPGAGELRADAEAALHRLTPAEIEMPATAKACGLARNGDVLTFSGEPMALRQLQGRFAKAGLALAPCGGAMALQLGPGVDVSPVLDLLADISAGKVAGVRPGLVEKAGLGSR